MAEPPQPSVLLLSAIVEAGNGIVQTKYAYFVAYAIVIYDHILTLDIEVEHIWKRRFSAVTLLFFLTRYYFLLAINITLFFFIEPVVSIKTCERILLFIPIGFGATLTALPNCVIAVRVYAMYEKNKKLAFALGLYILAQLGLSLWVDLTPSVSRIDIFAILGHPELGDAPAMRFCVPQLSTKLTGIQTSLGQILQSIFDTVVLALILLKARKCSGSGLITLIARQGLAYYILNVATYLTWTLMLLFAPAGSKQVMGGPALGFVCISINRLTLHLRSYTHDSDYYGDAEPSKSLAFAAKRPRRGSWLGASTLDVRGIPGDDETETFEMRDCDSRECHSHHLDDAS